MNSDHEGRIVSKGKVYPYTFFSLNGTLADYSTEKVHTHPFHQILMISEGVSMLVTETEKKPLYGSMCAFIPAGSAHRSIVVGSAVRYNSLYFADESREMDMIRVFSVSPLFRELFLRLSSELSHVSSQEMQRECFSLLLRLLPEEMGNYFQLILPQAVSDNCKKISDYIELNYARKLRLSDFCSVLPYCAKHISRLFFEEMSISIFEYIRMYRIFMASVLLQRERQGVLNTAYDCGYESISSFYADFKKYFSVSPRDFIKLTRQTGNDLRKPE